MTVLQAKSVAELRREPRKESESCLSPFGVAKKANVAYKNPQYMMCSTSRI